VDELSKLEIVGRVVRNASDEVIVTAGKYGLLDVVDIRWYKNDKPQYKGIRVNKEEAKLLLEILKRELDE
jgi:hypothetical protein|tara:strand:- start:7480 stop:7689 length:210 start_codon:yes stop_codon:yes gene_type:complete